MVRYPAGQTLSVDEGPGGQMSVSWTGRPENRRRAVVVVHCDVEGYWLDEGILEDGRLTLEGFHPNFENMSDHRVGAPLWICGGAVKSELLANGRLLGYQKHEGSGGRAFVKVLAECEPSVAQRILEMLRAGVAVTAQHRVLGVAGPDAEWDEETGIIKADALDNTAGVAAATTTLLRAVNGACRVNLTVLYTTGKEAGYLGLKQWVEESIGDDEESEVLWIALDCSSRDDSIEVPIDACIRRASSNPSESVGVLRRDQGRKYPADRAAIRVADGVSWADYAASRLLQQGAIESAVRELEGKQSDRSRPVPIASGAIFAGGACEMSVLRAARHRDLASVCGNFGSLAIPLGNFLLFSGKQWAPETTSLAAIEMASCVVEESVALFSRGARLASVERAAEPTAACKFWNDYWLKSWPPMEREQIAERRRRALFASQLLARRS